MPNDQISGVSQVSNFGTSAGVPHGAPAASGAATLSVTPAVPDQVAREQQPQPDAESVKKATDSINEFIKSTSLNLEFSVDKEIGAVVVKVVDRETGDVIRQIPSEEALAIAKNLDSVQQGVLLRSKA